MPTLRSLLLLLPLAVACEQEAGFQDAENSSTELTKGAMTVSAERIFISEIDAELTKPEAVFLFTERNDIDIPTGESQVWTVAATPPTVGMWEGAVRIESNDPTSPTLFITVCAVSKGHTEACPVEAPGTGDTGTDTADEEV